MRNPTQPTVHSLIFKEDDEGLQREPAPPPLRVEEELPTERTAARITSNLGSRKRRCARNTRRREGIENTGLKEELQANITYEGN